MSWLTPHGATRSRCALIPPLPPLCHDLYKTQKLTTGNQRRQPPGSRELGPEPSRGIEREPVHHQQPVVVRHSGPGPRRVRVQIHQGEQHGVGDLGGGPEPYVYGRVRSADGVGYLAVTLAVLLRVLCHGRESFDSEYKFWETSTKSGKSCHFLLVICHV